MFTKHVSELVYSDIEDLVQVRREKEGYHLDYKLTVFNNLDKAKKELAKDISAFANSSGGYLIIGVDKEYNIKGVSKVVQNKEIDEWINQVLVNNVEPAVFYFDPKVIQIPEKDEVVVVIHAPESTKKPHIVTDWNLYHIRINDSSKPANHNQVRDMFEFSRNRSDVFIDFLKRRNLFDEDTPNFGLNKNSSRLYNDIIENSNFSRPIVLFSFIPKYPYEERINIPIKNFIKWFNNNLTGYPPLPEKRLFDSNSLPDVKLDGLVFKHEQYPNGITSYFEVLNSGFLEVGLSNSVTKLRPRSSYGGASNEFDIVIFLMGIIGYEIMLMGFVRSFYKFINYYDEIFFQISFVNVLNVQMAGIHSKYQRIDPYWATRYRNNQHDNFKLTYKTSLEELTDENILSIAKLHSQKFCMAFGHEEDLCFFEDSLDLAQFNHFYF